MAEAADAFRLSDAVIAACTLLGPVLAVQAQKWLEGFREKRERRLTVFRTLMATRATNLSSAHVEALNAIPIDFYKDKRVMDVWEEYFAHLTNVPAGNPVWGQKRLDLFVKLLAAIANRVGYDFNVAEMNRIYFPTAHSEMEDEQNTIRKGVAAIFKAGGALPMAVKEFPTSAEAIDAQKRLLEKVSGAYDGGTLKVKVVD